MSILQFCRTVVPGHKLATKIGFPTMNFRSHRIDVKPGVYASIVTHNNKKYVSVSYFGPKMRHDINTLETHVMDTSFPKKKLYNQKVQVDFVSFIRKPQKFASVDELTDQIQCDVDQALDYFSKQS